MWLSCSVGGAPLQHAQGSRFDLQLPLNQSRCRSPIILALGRWMQEDQFTVLLGDIVNLKLAGDVRPCANPPSQMQGSFCMHFQFAGRSNKVLLNLKAYLHKM